MKIKISQNTEHGRPDGYLISTGEKGIKYKSIVTGYIVEHNHSFDDDRKGHNQTKFLLILDKGDEPK